MNIASATDRTKDTMVEHDDILSGIAAVLVSTKLLLCSNLIHRL